MNSRSNIIIKITNDDIIRFYNWSNLKKYINVLIKLSCNECILKKYNVINFYLTEFYNGSQQSIGFRNKKAQISFNMKILITALRPSNWSKEI